MSDFLPNHSPISNVSVHRDLPIYETHEFDFYRCVRFSDALYEKTVSELHQGNLRVRNSGNRYSSVFPGEKVSYWADSKTTAFAEMRKHKQGHNLLCFSAYDDSSSSFPTLSKEREELKIIDGRDLGLHEILKKDDNGVPLSAEEAALIAQIWKESPDCLAYWSEARKGGVNFLFFEKGFRKLAIKEVSLRMGDSATKNKNRIVCAATCDYKAFPENYGKYFMPKAKIRYDASYERSEECLNRKSNSQYWFRKSFSIVF